MSGRALWRISPARSAAPEAALDRASIAPAGLAALAEVGVIFLPLQELVREMTYARGGPLVAWQGFAPLFIAGVIAATWFRRFAGMTSVAAGVAIAVGILQTVVWGRGSLFAGAPVVLLSLLVALRAVTLAARDHRDPIGVSVAVGAVALLLEVAIGASDAPQPWPSLIAPVVVVFFVASLASRTASTRIEASGVAGSPLGQEVRQRGTIARMGIAGIMVIAALLVAIVAGAGHGGFLGWTGGAILVGLRGLLLGVAWVLSPLVYPLYWVARVVNWLFHLFGHSRPVKQVPGFPGAQGRGHASAWERILQVGTFLALATALVLVIRKRRRVALRPLVRGRPPDPRMVGGVVVGPSGGDRRPFGFRRELPEVLVRRWYAEVLLLLERRELPKPDHLTPAEFVPMVARAFPSVRPSFEDLTRAYEDVRYGEREITRDRLARLKDRRPILMETLRSSERADVAADQDADTDPGTAPPAPWITS
jgi:hypothetical protein